MWEFPARTAPPLPLSPHLTPPLSPQVWDISQLNGFLEARAFQGADRQEARERRREARGERQKGKGAQGVATAAEKAAVTTAAEAERCKLLAGQKQLVYDVAIGAPRQQRGAELAELRRKQRDAETAAHEAAESAFDLTSRALAGSPLLGMRGKGTGLIERLNLDGDNGDDDDDPLAEYDDDEMKYGYAAYDYLLSEEEAQQREGCGDDDMDYGDRSCDSENDGAGGYGDDE